jgi:PAS domain S-box-containing protein
MLGQAANKAMVVGWDELGETLDTSREQLRQIIVSLIGILLAGAALCVHFLMALREARRRTRLLDKEKAFSELLIGSSGEGIVAVDLGGRCTLWNEAAERLFDHPAGTTIGLALDDVSGFFQIDRIGQAIGKALGGQPAALFDQPFFPSEQGGPVYVDVRCFSLRDGERIIGSILLISDVTERRAAQKEIADHRDRLEQLVQARTRELDAALERERETAELYRNFGTMISHQFRTPLAIVDSALQRLMRRSDRLSPTEVLERGGKARLAINRLTKLVESTLDAARLDAGQIEISTEPCDLGQLAAEICARQNEQASDTRIKIALPEDGSAVAHCDPVHVENILLNLLSNAVKYSPAGTPIDVVLMADATRIECAVINNGTLDGPTERKALFERYFRGRNAEGRQGIGVGLYMARALARLQGGDVHLQQSAPGTIRLALVLPRSEPRPAAVPTVILHQEPA